MAVMSCCVIQSGLVGIISIFLFLLLCLVLSMRSIIFANYLGRDTMRLSPTLDVEHRWDSGLYVVVKIVKTRSDVFFSFYSLLSLLR